MELNYFGLTIFLLSSFLVLINKKISFLDLYIFFIGFNSTAICFISEETAISLPFAFLMIIIILFIYNEILLNKFELSKLKILDIKLLLILGVIILLSQTMPYFLDNNYKVLARYETLVFYAKEKTLHPSMQWITQSLYFLIGLVSVFIFLYYYKTAKQIKRALFIFIIGFTFVLCWGYLEYFCFFLNIKYPFEIFNHIGMTRNGILILEDFPRMTSVTMEPSYLAQLLVPGSALFFWFYKKETIKSLKGQILYVFFLLTLFALLISNSSTGLVGLLLVVFFYFLNSVKIFNKRSKFLLLLAVIICTVIISYFSIQLFINKADTFSGVERIKTLYYGMKYFLDYPILGIGWGVMPTFDLLINLLVNFGILGTLVFSLLIYVIIRRLNDKITVKNDNEYLYQAAKDSLILLLLVSQLSGFIYHSQYFWVYLGFAISISHLKSNEIFDNNTDVK